MALKDILATVQLVGDSYNQGRALGLQSRQQDMADREQRSMETSRIATTKLNKEKFGIVEKSPISMTANAGTGGRVLTKESCSYRVYLDPVTGEEIPESIVFCPGDTLTSDTPEPKWNRHGCSADPGFHHEHLEETRKAIAELGVQK
jgi:hypothetical protein